jgi:hypothetical protein
LCLIAPACVAGVIGLGCLGSLALLIRWDMKVEEARTKATGAADEFLELLRQKRLDDAHRAYGGSWTAETFRDFVGRHPALTAHTSRNVRSWFRDPARGQTTVLVILRGPAGAPDTEVRVDVLETGGGWRVRAITFE